MSNSACPKTSSGYYGIVLFSTLKRALLAGDSRNRRKQTETDGTVPIGLITRRSRVGGCGFRSSWGPHRRPRPCACPARSGDGGYPRALPDRATTDKLRWHRTDPRRLAVASLVGISGCRGLSPCDTRAPAGTQDNGLRWILVDWESCCPSADRSGGIPHQELDPAWLSSRAEIRPQDAPHNTQQSV